MLALVMTQALPDEERVNAIRDRLTALRNSAAEISRRADIAAQHSRDRRERDIGVALTPRKPNRCV